MEYLLVLAVVSAVVAMVLVVMKKPSSGGNKRAGSKRSRKGGSPAAASEPQPSFRATKIVLPANACQAARHLQDKLFLDSELDLPRLPLPDCTQAPDCRCKYERRDDRRNGEDDRRFHTLATELYPAASKGEERRRPKRGRRFTDR